MKPHRAFWTLLSVLIIASLLLAACGGGQATEEPAPAPTAAPAEVEAPTEAPVEPAPPAEPADAMMGPDGRASYAGLDKDLSGITIRMAAIGGGGYEAMYETIKLFHVRNDQAVRGEDRRQGRDGVYR